MKWNLLQSGQKKSGRNIAEIARLQMVYFVLMVMGIIGANVSQTLAASVPDPILYEGRLLDISRQVITSAHSFRFSFWKSNDYSAVNDSSGGAINITSPNYSGWQEVQEVSPNISGTFSLRLGEINALPPIDYALHKYLQVEIKPAASPDTAYQLMDPTGDNGADVIDRKTIGSVPYAKVSGSSGSTDLENFVLDADNTISNAATGSIQLQFGTTLGKILEYDFDNSFFRFNDDVHIEGNLTLTGLVDGVDISGLVDGNHDQNTDSGTDKTTFEINTGGPKLIVDSAGITADRLIRFYDGDIVVVGEDSSQTLTNKTIDGDNNTITNIDISAMKDRNRTILLAPELENISLNPDGSDNMVSLNQGYDEAADQRYYVLSSEEGVLQDLDIILPIMIPDDFSAWQAVPVQMDIKSSSTIDTENQIDITMLDSSGAAVTITGGDNIVGTVAELWVQKNITFSGSPTFTAGGSATLRLKMQSKSGNRIYVGRIRLHYVGK